MYILVPFTVISLSVLFFLCVYSVDLRMAKESNTREDTTLPACALGIQELPLEACYFPELVF